MEASTTKRHLNVDEILAKIGEFGRFQIILVAVITMANIPIVIQPFFMYFGTLAPMWECNLNSTLCMLNGSFPAADMHRCNFPREEWHYLEKKDFSLVTEFNIDCKRKWILSLVSSSFFVGWAFGAIIIGKLADAYGRRKFIFLGVAAVLTTGCVTPFMPNIYLVIACRFVIGFFFFSSRIQSYIMLSEFIGNKYRPLATTIFATLTPLMWMVLALQAYLVKNWKILSYINTAPYAFVLLFYFFVPESIRWLKVNNRKDEIMKILQKIARSNKKEFPVNFSLIMPNARQVNPSSYIDIFRKNTSRSFVQCYIWLVTALSFYGIHVAVSNLEGSVYRNFVLVSIIEIPAGFLTIPLCKKYVRKKTTLIPLFLTGIFCFIIGFLPDNETYKIARITIGVIGKGVIYATFHMLYLWSAEILPTDTRAKGIGMFQISSRIGSISSPWVSNGLKEYGGWIPFALMGVITICGSFLGTILPETKNVAMKDSIEDVDKDGNDFTTDPTNFDNKAFSAELKA